jgi:hypothetical protein
MPRCLGRYYPKCISIHIFLPFECDIVPFSDLSILTQERSLNSPCPPPDDFTEVLNELHQVTLASNGNSGGGVARICD